MLFGLVSAIIKERCFIGEGIVATCLGIAFGPHGAGLLDPRSWTDDFDALLLAFTRIVIALSVCDIGIELPNRYVKVHWQSLSILLGPTMLWGWLSCGAIIFWLVPGLGFLPALAASACVSPTDPILAASVVGKSAFARAHVPAHIRHVLQAESGANDGAAYPFLLLSLQLLARGQRSAIEAVGYWTLIVMLYQILLGVIYGAVIGYAAGRAVHFARKRHWIDRESLIALEIALALVVDATTMLWGGDDLLATFAAGCAFGWTGTGSETEGSEFGEILEQLLNWTCFAPSSAPPCR